MRAIADTPEGVGLLQEDLRAETRLGWLAGGDGEVVRQVPPGRGGTRMLRRKEGGSEEVCQ